MLWFILVFGLVVTMSIVVADLFLNCMKGKCCGANVASEKEESAKCSCQEEKGEGMLASVNFEEILRKTLLVAISFIKWYLYLTLSLVILLIFVPRFLNFSGDELWYKLACIGLVAIYPIFSIVKHWALVRKGWAFVSGTFVDFRSWLYKKEKAE